MKPGQVNRQIPHSRIPLRWRNIEQLILKLAAMREFPHGRCIELLTDKETHDIIVRLFARFHGLRITLYGREQLSPLGFAFSSLTCRDKDRTELRVVHDKWFDDYRKSRKKRGWRKREAYVLDWSNVKIEGEKITVTDREKHRRITFQ